MTERGGLTREKKTGSKELTEKTGDEKTIWIKKRAEGVQHQRQKGDKGHLLSFLAEPIKGSKGK